MAKKLIEVNTCDYPGCEKTAMDRRCEICGAASCYLHYATIHDWKQLSIRVCHTCLERMAERKGAQ